MGRPIRIIAGDVGVAAELNDTQTATAIWAALPIEARGQTWGDEIYFAIAVRAAPDAHGPGVFADADCSNVPALHALDPRWSASQFVSSSFVLSTSTAYSASGRQQYTTRSGCPVRAA